MPGASRRFQLPTAELKGAARFRSELRRFLRETETVTSQEGLTPERYDLLLMIEAGEVEGRRVTVGGLQEALQLKQQGVTELVGRAIRAGLVTRERSAADGRVYHLRLTPEGETVLLRVFRGLRASRASFAEAFDRLDVSFRAFADDRARRPSDPAA